MPTRSNTFLLCIRNDDCEDLELRKICPALADAKARKEGFVRVVDESGEAYLYPEGYFVEVHLAGEAAKLVRASA